MTGRKITAAEGHRAALDAFIANPRTSPHERALAVAVRDMRAGDVVERAATRSAGRRRVTRAERQRMAAAITAERRVDASLEARQAMRREILRDRGWSHAAIEDNPGEVKWLPSSAPVQVNTWELKTAR